MKLQLVRLTGRTNLTLPLERNDRIDERGVLPRLRNTGRLRSRYDVSRRLFNHAKAIKFQLPDDGRFAGARCPGHDEPEHKL